MHDDNPKSYFICICFHLLMHCDKYYIKQQKQLIQAFIWSDYKTSSVANHL